MRLTILLVIPFVLYGCATAGQGKQIVPDEVRWIEKERTTRPEIVARFGLPPVEFPQVSGFTSTSTTTMPSEGHTEAVQLATRTEHPMRLRKAIYVSPRHEGTGFPFYDNLQSTPCQFWVVYDDKGVVQDYGFLTHSCDGQIQDRDMHVAAQ